MLIKINMIKFNKQKIIRRELMKIFDIFEDINANDFFKMNLIKMYEK